MQGFKQAVVAAAFAATLGAAQPARAEFLEDAGWGSLTVLSNVFYMPAKIVYASLGGLTGGLAYGLTGGDLDVANKIWVPSMSGTYVVTPPMLRGEETIVFVGGGGTATARNEYRPVPAPEVVPDDALAEEPLGGS